MRKKNARSGRLHRRWLWIVLAAIIALAVVVDRAGLLLVGQRDDMARYHGEEARVVRAISAHTLEIAIADTIAKRETTRVRLIGVNAPLPAHRNRAAEAGAEEALALTTALVLGEVVVLELEGDRTRDTFGRLLAHVELPDGRMLNATLLEAGLARADDHWPHTRLTRYAKAEQLAQRRGSGIWAD